MEILGYPNNFQYSSSNQTVTTDQGFSSSQTFGWIKVADDASTVSTITIQNNSSNAAGLQAVRVNGRILVDQGIAGAPTTGNSVLTLAGDTDLAYFRVGDVVGGGVKWSSLWEETAGGASINNPELGFNGVLSDVGSGSSTTTIDLSSYGFANQVVEWYNNNGSKQGANLNDEADPTGTGNSAVGWYTLGTVPADGRCEITLNGYGTSSYIAALRIGGNILIDGTPVKVISTSEPGDTNHPSITVDGGDWSDSNYLQLSTTDKSTNITLNADKLSYTVAAQPGKWDSIKTSEPLPSGKWYWEFIANQPIGGSGMVQMVGIGTSSADIENYPGNDANGYSYYYDASKYNSGSGESYGDTWNAGDVIGIAFDTTTGTLNFYKNGVDQGVAWTGLTGTFYPMSGADNESVSNPQPTVLNFGPTFVHTPPAGFEGPLSSNNKVTCQSPLKAPIDWTIERINGTVLDVAHSSVDNSQVWVADDNQAGKEFVINGGKIVDEPLLTTDVELQSSQFATTPADIDGLKEIIWSLNDVEQSAGTLNPYKPTGLAVNTEYRVKVKHLAQNIGESEWSQTTTFFTGASRSLKEHYVRQIRELRIALAEAGEPKALSVEDESPRKRARNADGTYRGDDPSTPDVNEAWEGGEEPLAKGKRKGKKS
jgi:hypothetical protein